MDVKQELLDAMHTAEGLGLHRSATICRAAITEIERLEGCRVGFGQSFAERALGYCLSWLALESAFLLAESIWALARHWSK